MKKSGAKTAVIVIAAIVIVLAVLAGLTYRFGGGLIMPNNPDLDKYFYNKYNNMGYVDKTGETIKTLVDQNNAYAEDDDDKITIAQFKEEYDLPKDMRGDTNITAAEYSIPISTFAEMNNVSFDELKEFYELGDEVNDQMTWGEIQGEVTIKVAIGGEENLEAFKEEYGFGDEVTLDTKWKEVRNAIDEAEKEEYEKQKEQYEQMMAELEAQQESGDETDAQTSDDSADAAPADSADAAADAE